MSDETPAAYQYCPAVAFDTETHPLGMGQLIPKLVCVAVASDGDAVDVFAACETDKLDAFIQNVLQAEASGLRIVGHNMGFDLAILCGHRPDIIPAIFDLLAKGVFECTMIREMLLHLTSHGNLEMMDVENEENEGETITYKLLYGLEDLGRRYLGKNRTDDKTLNDSWRTHYNVLDGKPVSEWPEDAVRYVAEDAQDTIMIRERQEAERIEIWKNIGHDPFEVLSFRVMAQFCLYLMSAWGFRTDAAQKEKLEAELMALLTPEKMKSLIEAGWLAPGCPAAPYKNGARNADGTQKMKAAVKEKRNTKFIQAYVKDWCEKRGLPVKMSDPSEKCPEGQVSTKSEFFKANRHDDALFMDYFNRQKLQKLVNTELPRMTWNGVTAAVVHPGYNVLVRTGRTSSRASKLYPSANIQNVDPRVRDIFIPRDGYLFFSVDYNQMELATAAQKCYSLFGHSVLRDKINEGIDVHSYLGAQLAYNLDPKFQAACNEAGASDAALIFRAFSALKKSDKPEMQKFFAHYRKFAKPTGLGYPGGLGAKTFVEFAKGVYDVVVDEEMAKKLREIWKATFPEFVKYFDWINNQCRDPFNPDRYSYLSPLGMYRAGADYCAAANGAALQTNSAEGALLAGINLVRACFDRSLCSILCDEEKGPTCRPIAFIHDEYVGEVRDDEMAVERVNEIARIMVESMQVITPDVKARANPVLMRRWYKDAEPVFDANGRLRVWELSDRKK